MEQNAIFLKARRKKDKGAKHEHICYINTKNGIGITSENTKDKHHHKIEIDEGGFIMLPAGENQHTHDMIDYEPPISNLEKDEQERVKKCQLLFRELKDYNAKALKDAKEAEKFFMGDQWNSADKSELEGNGRAALTINEIEPKIMLLSGYQRNNRTDFKFLPVENGDQKVADIYNMVVKQILELTSYWSEEIDAFENQITVGIGYLGVVVSYDDDLRGKIEIASYDWKDILLGPHTKMDGSDCEVMIRKHWMSEKNLKGLYPEKMDAITSYITTLNKGNNELGTVESDGTRYTGNQYSAGSEDDDDLTSGDKLVKMDKYRREYLMIEVWRKEFRRVPIFVNEKDNVFHNADGVPKNHEKWIESIPGFRVIPRKVKDIRVSKLIGNVMLDDEYPELYYNDFPIVPIYANKKGDYFWGKIGIGTKDMQREVNKRHSQAVDAINKSNNYGWFIDPDTFVSPSEATKFRKTATQAGFVATVKNVARLPQKVEGGKFPSELINMEEISARKLNDQMGINMELMGVAQGSQQSGVAQREKREQALVGNRYIFDNLALSKKQIARRIIAAIATVYTPERILRLIMNGEEYKRMTVGGKRFVGTPEGQSDPSTEITLQAIAQILDDTSYEDLMQYDVSITDSPYNPTIMRSNLQVWLELARTRPEVPIDMLIDLDGDLPMDQKEKFKQILDAQRQAQMQAEQAKQQTEIAKTQIAQQGKQQTDNKL